MDNILISLELECLQNLDSKAAYQPRRDTLEVVLLDKFV